MSLATIPNGSPEAAMSADTLERVVVGGDLSKLSPDQRLQYYMARCQAAGFHPATRPFEYIVLKNKLTLYATKTATDQLIAGRHLSVEILSRGIDEETGLYHARARVTFPGGQQVEDIAFLNVKGLAGEELANAIMKCVTKAKRRTVLSACGLGMPDELEVEEFRKPGSEFIPPEVKDVARQDVNRYEAWLADYVTRANDRWLDRWTDRGSGEIPADVKELLSPFQLTNHLIKWAVREGILPADLPDGNYATRLKIAAKLWLDHGPQVVQEAKEYVGRLAQTFVDQRTKALSHDQEPFDETEQPLHGQAQAEPGEAG